MKTKDKDLVSVIMPTFNRAYIIARSIKSVLKQTHHKIELLIIDDGSTDETEEIVSGLNDGRIRYLKLERNMGANYARNQGLAAARGEYIAFLDSDNVWEKVYLEKRLEILRKSGKNVGGVFGYTRIKQSNGMSRLCPALEVGKKIAHCRTNAPIIRRMLFETVMDTNTAVFKRSCIESVLGFREELRRSQEWEYFFRILYFSGYRIKFTEDCLVKNYVRKDSISHGNDVAYWEARLFFLKQYREILLEYNCLEEVACYLLLKAAPFLSEDDLYKILNILGANRIKKVVWLIRKEYRKLAKKAGAADYFAWLNEKNNKILSLQGRWMALMQNGVHLSEILLWKGYRNIAIYGYGYLGKALYRELANSECHVAYVIDKRSVKSDGEIKIIKPTTRIQEVDAVIVTAIAEYEEIKEKYEKDVRYISFADIIDIVEKEKMKNE